MKEKENQNEWKTLSIMTAVFLLSITLCIMVCAAFVIDYISDIYANFESSIYVKETATDKRWNSLVQLNVFEPDEDFLLYPTCSGSYTFEIYNDVDFPISYRMSITDENIAKVPLKFRLRDADDQYLVGNAENWVSISELLSIPGTLEYAGTTKYTLDWTWVGDDDYKDTQAGIIAQDRTFYVLNFEILAEQNGAPINSQIDPAPEVSNIAFWVTVIASALLVCVYGLIWSMIKKKEDPKP